MERYKNTKKINKEIYSVVDGKTDQKEVLNIFKNKYRAILDDPFSQTRPKNMIISWKRLIMKHIQRTVNYIVKISIMR